MKLLQLLESAYIRDVSVKSLAPDIRSDIKRFAGTESGHVVQYGMVAAELVSKADPENLKVAKTHIKDSDRDECFNEVRDHTSNGTKYILLLHDKMIDGHHYLAKALHAGVTSSLGVLDITPLKFQ